MNTIEDAILETLTYHDLFEFPMTAHEICLTLPSSRNVSRHTIFDALKSLEKADLVGHREGFWYLLGREMTVARRKKRYDVAERKFRIAKRFFRFARHISFLRAVYVCNTLARSNAREESDIDLFIVVAPARIWIARLFVTGFAKLLRARPDHITSKDRLCLSFFASENALDFRAHAIENDVYLPHWIFDLYPLYDESGVSGKIFAENAWVRDRLSGLRRPLGSMRRTIFGGRGALKTFLERTLDRSFLESWAKSFQLRIMPERLRKRANTACGVVISDTTLKLHGLDRRAEIRDRFERAVSACADKACEYAGTA